jgi:hypothetical protein
MGAAMAPVDVKLTPYGNTVIIQDFWTKGGDIKKLLITQ